jgi:hypothetical protein
MDDDGTNAFGCTKPNCPRCVPIAKPKREPIDLNEFYQRISKRYPNILARLAE